MVHTIRVRTLDTLYDPKDTQSIYDYENTLGVHAKALRVMFVIKDRPEGALLTFSVISSLFTTHRNRLRNRCTLP